MNYILNSLELKVTQFKNEIQKFIRKITVIIKYWKKTKKKLVGWVLL